MKLYRQSKYFRQLPGQQPAGLSLIFSCYRTLAFPLDQVIVRLVVFLTDCPHSSLIMRECHLVPRLLVTHTAPLPHIPTCHINTFTTVIFRFLSPMITQYDEGIYYSSAQKEPRNSCILHNIQPYQLTNTICCLWSLDPVLMELNH